MLTLYCLQKQIVNGFSSHLLAIGVVIPCAARMRAGQPVRIIDCRQFADKTQLVGRLVKLRNRTRFPSRTQIEDLGRKVEKLRNNLAHSPVIVIGDWGTIVTWAENLASILDGPPGLHEV